MNRRQATGKDGSFARCAFHGYGTLQAIQYFFYDHQPQARSFFHELFGIGGSEKFRKETGDIISGDADTGVTDLKPDTIAVFRAQLHAHLSSRRCIFDGIGNQVGKQFVHELLICQDEGEGFLDVEGDIHFLFGGQDSVRFHQAFQYHCRLDGMQDGLGQVRTFEIKFQQVGNHVSQDLEAFYTAVEGFFLFLGYRAVTQISYQIEHAQNGIQR